MPTPRSAVNTLIASNVVEIQPHGNEAVIQRYIRYRVQVDNWRPKTVQDRTNQLRRFGDHFPTKRMIDLTEDDLFAWNDSLKVGTQARASYTSAVRGLYEWASVLARPRLRVDDPSAALRRPRVPATVPRPIRNADLDLALAAAVHDLQLFVWLILACCLGLRCCEIAWLRVGDVEDRDDGSARLHVTGKKGKRRVVPAPPDLVELLRPFLHGQGSVFTRVSDDGPHTPARVSSLINKHLHGLDIAATAHRGRHRFAGDFHQLDKDVLVLMRTMGHSRPDTTAGYTQTDADAAAPAIAQLVQRRVGQHLRRTG